MLSVGHGPAHVLVVARPHPDEPVGAVTALALAERVARGDGHAPAADPARATWNFVLCLDPDGSALSEGIEAATAGPAPSLERYFRTAFIRWRSSPSGRRSSRPECRKARRCST
ncbi:hypothetical protein STENM223S_09185 [Streptomyces tendae]